MAAKGKILVLAIGDGATPTEAFATIGGARSNSFTWNNEQVDVSSKDSNGFVEKLEGAGLSSISTSISGVASDDDAFADLVAAATGNTIGNYKITTTIGTFTGAFAITSFDMGGEHNGEQTYSATLESAGEITFVAA